MAEVGIYTLLFNKSMNPHFALSPATNSVACAASKPRDA
jgi:hypothetical protein